MKTLFQLFEDAEDRFYVELLPNGFIRTFDRTTKAATLFNLDSSYRSGFGGPDAEAAVRKFLNNQQKPEQRPEKKRHSQLNPYDVRLRPSIN